MQQPAFLFLLPSQGHFAPPFRSDRKPASSRRRTTPQSQRRLLVACAPLGPEDERTRDEAAPKQPKKSGDSGPTVDDLDPTDLATMAEIDHLAEQWIGSDLGRWEWYERVKARRDRMLLVQKESDEKLGAELQELKRTFMEIDAVFGTNMMKNNEVSAAGWSTVVLVMLLYIVIGYWAFELVVRWLTSLIPSSFP